MFALTRSNHRHLHHGRGNTPSLAVGKTRRSFLGSAGLVALGFLAAPPASAQIVAGPVVAQRSSCQTESVWGIAPDDSVWRWTPSGSSGYWTQPNAAARLRQISVGVGEVWGTTSNNHVWRWNPVGSVGYWSEPNSQAVLAQVSVGRGKTAGVGEVWGIGVNQSVWRWVPVGSSGYWYEPSPGTVRYQISVGSHDNIWSIGTGNRVYKWNGAGWVEPDPLARGWQVEANNCGQDAWKLGTIGIQSVYPIFKWSGNWSIPNVNAAATQISAKTPSRAWAIGVNYRVFSTADGGASWQEPNAAATLRQVSVGLK